MYKRRPLAAPSYTSFQPRLRFNRRHASSINMVAIRSLLLLAAAGLVAGKAPCGSAPAATAPATPKCKTIAEVAADAGTFETLLAAATAAGLADALADKDFGPVTVFAPTDDAFSEIEESVLADLLKPENKDDLLRILGHHVVEGEVFSKDAKDGAELDTIAETTLPIEVDGKTITVDGAKVTAADIEACNGLVHVIDTVMIPE